MQIVSSVLMILWWCPHLIYHIFTWKWDSQCST